MPGDQAHLSLHGGGGGGGGGGLGEGGWEPSSESAGQQPQMDFTWTYPHLPDTTGDPLTPPYTLTLPLKHLVTSVQTEGQ